MRQPQWPDIKSKHMQSSKFPSFPRLELGDREPILKKLQLFAFFRGFFALCIGSNIFITFCFKNGYLSRIKDNPGVELASVLLTKKGPENRAFGV